MKDVFASLRRFVNNLRLGPKLRLLYMLACVVPCLVLGLCTIINTRVILLEQRSKVVRQKHAQTRVAFSNAATLLVNVSTGILFNDNLRTLLTTQYAQEHEAYLALWRLDNTGELLKNYAELAYIAIYTDNPGLSMGVFRQIDDEVRQSQWFQVAAESKGVIRWYSDGEEKDSRLRLVRKMPLGEGRFAVMVLGLSDSQMRLQLSDGDLQTQVYLDGDTLIYSSRPGVDLSLPDGWQASGGQPVLTQWDGLQTLLCADEVRIQMSPSSFTVITTDLGASPNLWQTSWQLALLLSMLLTTTTILVWIFTYMLERRVSVLRDQMRSIASGSLDTRRTVSGQDELGQLFQDMMRTLNVLEELNKAVYRKELSVQKLLACQKEIEYKLLASQVNPHFLFNTLEAIRMKAAMNQDKEVAFIVRKLGMLMRRLLSASDTSVRLSEELNLIRDYLDIQQFRYGEKISYQILPAEGVDIENKRLLPLLLLPLVENAVLHGLETKLSTGVVRVELWAQEGRLHIRVSDNGVGMDEETCRTLTQRMETRQDDLQGQSIGLYNVNQRIKLCYGSQYGLKIHSRLGEGTQVELSLPLDEEGKA